MVNVYSCHIMHTYTCSLVRVVIEIGFIAQTRCLLIVVDRIAGVGQLPGQVFTYAYILMLMSMV